MKRNKLLSIRFILALYIGKILQLVIKVIAKNRGTNLPGEIAIKICPDFLSRIGRPETVIAVTGTNGKTSTSNFINDILRRNDKITVNNSKGSNMPSGIASSLIEVSDMKGCVHADVAVLEVDERASGFVYDHIKPDYLVCTNLFRDSIKRNGHSEFILTKIKSSVPESTTLILNADDLISSTIGTENNEKAFFAVGKLDSDHNFDNIVCDIITCPNCKSKLEFKYRHYHHIGSLYCPECDFKSPRPNFLVDDVDFKKGVFTVKEHKEKAEYPLISDSVFNVYNLVAAIAVLRAYGLSHTQIKKGMKGLSIKRDRMANDRVNNVEITTMLSKDQNPISCSRMFDYVAETPGNKAIILLITDSKDYVHGSEDISWLYDTDFEYLNTPDIKQIVVGGTRCCDVLLRLKMAGISDNKIKVSPTYENIETMLNLKNIDKVFILYELYAYPLAYKTKQKLMHGMGEKK